jgi:hypothetical protein
MPPDPLLPGRAPARKTVVLLAAVTLLVILLGCMSISIGKFGSSPPPEDDGMLCQGGEVELALAAERDVYYPVPYPSPPHLDISDPFGKCELVEQKPDHFRVRSTFEKSALGGPFTLKWKAKGLKMPPPAPPPGPAPLPAEPVPVDHPEPPGKPR